MADYYAQQSTEVSFASFLAKPNSVHCTLIFFSLFFDLPILKDTQASIRYQNGYKPIVNEDLFPSYNNMAVGRNSYQFRTIIKSGLIRLCPKNNYPAKIELVECL